jgi:hypothetical protein
MVTIEFDFGIGDSVIICALEYPGRVEAMIDDVNGKQYKVVYWWDGTRHSVWMNAWELKAQKKDV